MWRAPGRLLSLQPSSSIQRGKILGSRNLSNRNPSASNTSTVLSVGGAVAVTLVGGSVLLAKTSDSYRDFTEKYIPGTPFIYSLVLGPKPENIAPVTQIKSWGEEEGLVKKKLERDASKNADDKGNLLVITTEGTSSILPQLEPPKPSSDGTLLDESEPTEATTGGVEDAVPPTITENETEKSDEASSNSEAFPAPVISEETRSEEVSPTDPSPLPDEDSVKVAPVEVSDPADFPALLNDLQRNAVEAVSKAVLAQDEAASAIKKHVEMVYKALEMVYDPSLTPERVWEPVFQATQNKIDAVQRAESTAKQARLAVAVLKETVAHGIKNDQSIETPDLITLDESVARALYSLETAKARVEAAQSEAKVMDEYRNLVDTARHHLQLELSSIRPELAPSFKSGDSHLGEEELNILMAHAYWKIITLQKELARQQGLEQQRLRSALETQRKEDATVMESRMRVEMEKQYYELKAQFNHDMAMHEKNMSEQFTQQMKRQAAAHSDHLNEVLATQHAELSRKHQNQLELLAAENLLARSQELAKLVGLAKGIQDSVHGRAEKDRLARQVRELWIAAQSMIDSLRSNSSAHLRWEEQRRALSEPLALLAHVAINDQQPQQHEFVKHIVNSIPEEAVAQGVLPQGAIKERFIDVERVCRKVALIDDNGGSLIKYALSYLQSLLVIKTEPRFLPENHDVDKLTTFDILARARYHLEKDDLQNALRYMNLLRGEPFLAARDWLHDLRLHLEAVQAAQAILVYAAVTSIESM